jgi:hypothetical protein
MADKGCGGPSLVGCLSEPSQEIPTWWMPRGSGGLASLLFFSDRAVLFCKTKKSLGMATLAVCPEISIDGSRLSLVARPILALTSVVPLYQGSGIWMSQ